MNPLNPLWIRHWDLNSDMSSVSRPPTQCPPNTSITITFIICLFFFIFLGVGGGGWGRVQVNPLNPLWIRHWDLNSDMSSVSRPPTQCPPNTCITITFVICYFSSANICFFFLLTKNNLICKNLEFLKKINSLWSLSSA